MALKRELIYIDGKDETNRIELYSYRGDKCVIVFKNNNREFAYGTNRAKVIKTAITSDDAFHIFNYLKEIAETVGLKTEDGENILSRSYDSITEISQDCVLSHFLNGGLPSV